MNRLKSNCLLFCSLLLALFFILVIPAKNAAALSVAAVLNIDYPIFGEKLPYDIKMEEYGKPISYTSGYIKNGVVWYKDNSYYVNPNVDVAEKGHTYKVIIYFADSDSSNKYAGAYIFGDFADVHKTSDYEKSVYKADYYVEYEITPYIPIEEVNVYIDRPVEGKLFDYSLEFPEGAQYKEAYGDIHSSSSIDGVTWRKGSWFVDRETETANVNFSYYADIEVKANDGYIFTEDTVCKVNDGSIAVDRIYFPTTDKLEFGICTEKMSCVKSSDVNKKITAVKADVVEPQVGNLADYEPKFPSDAGYKCEDFNLKWYDITSGMDEVLNPSTGKFLKDHKYKVVINLKAKDGYCFVEDIDAKVNNKAAVFALTDAYNAMLTQVFDLSIKPEPTSKPTPATTAKPTAIPTAASSVKIKLDKSNANVVCGKNLTLKATVTGSKGTIIWKSSDSKVAGVDKNGKVTGKTAGTVTIYAAVSGVSTTCKVTVLYKDVTNSKDFWYAPTNYLTANGVVKGYDKQTKFKPANVCTRAQMVTFIWRLQSEPAPLAKTCKFKDVKKTDYFYKACIWGNENHIVEGYKDGTFGPQIVCARKHAVTFLWRLANKPAPKTKTNKFKDVKKGDYFYEAVLWASEKGIVAGYKDNTFKPSGYCLRRQMVTFLYKYDKFINNKGK